VRTVALPTAPRPGSVGGAHRPAGNTGHGADERIPANFD